MYVCRYENCFILILYVPTFVFQFNRPFRTSIKLLQLHDGNYLSFYFQSIILLHYLLKYHIGILLSLLKFSLF